MTLRTTPSPQEFFISDPLPKILVWKETMTTGVTEIDAQHKYLVDFINDLGYSIRKKYSPEDILKVLQVLKFYAEQHFAKEETCMERYHCPFAGKNQKAHRAFVEKLREYQKEYETSSQSNDLATRIHTDLIDWTVNHIMTIDTELFSYTQSTTPPEI